MRITETDRHCATELKILRKMHHLKQQVMAEYLNLDTQQQYSDFENGKKHFTHDMILKICSVFNVSPLQFVDQKKSSNLLHILKSEDYLLIESSKDNDLKLMLYKKLFLESKIENIESRLNILQKTPGSISNIPSKHKLHVII